MSSEAIGILSIGTYLPEHVRTNNWWPEHIVEKWRGKAPPLFPDSPEAKSLSPGQRRVLEAMAQHANDPFAGSLQRRVAPEDMASSHMEVLAAEDALKRAGVNKQRIGVLLSHSSVPDFLISSNACRVHNELGLRRDCYSLSVEGGCNAFMQQMTLASALLKSGQADYALLTQSCTASRIIPPETPTSAWFGEAATAVLIGRVKEGFGMISSAHGTDGSSHGAAVGSVPGREHWYEEGRVWWYPREKHVARRIILDAPDQGNEVIGRALRSAHLVPNDVDFYASHQPTIWFRRVTQEHAGLTRARSIDTFQWAASVSACNIPLVFATAEKEKLIAAGDITAAYAGGIGVVFSAFTMRWGIE